MASTAQTAGLQIDHEMTQTGWVVMSEKPGAGTRGIADISARLHAIPGVLVVEPVYLQFLSTTPRIVATSAAPGALASNDPFRWLQWGTFSVNATDAWEITQGAGVTVAVIDSGVDSTHEDLAGQVLPGFDFWSNDSDPSDVLGHGTHVAGTIAAARNNSLGGTGISPEASILPVRVCGPTYEDGCPTTLQDQGIRWAVDHGADVINLSLGGSSPTQIVQDAIAYAIAHDVVVVAAAGNDGINQIQYPAAYPGVVGVGALTPGRDRASFSNTGTHVDIVAPGSEILSTVPGDYEFYDGTSMASPHVAGVAALVRAGNPGLTNSQISDRLLATAVDLGPAGYDTSFGAGAVDAYRALTNGGNPTGDYFEIEINHSFIHDLTVGVSHSESAVRTLFIPEFRLAGSEANIHVRYSLPDISLSAVPGTWVLLAADEFSGFSGSIVGFRFRSEGVNYSYQGSPVAIPDGTSVFASVGGIIPDADSTLSTLTISDGTLDPIFDAATTAYTASVANSVESIDVTATTSDVDATLDIDGPATSGVPETIPLSVGENVIDVVVTAADTFNDTTYTVIVTRELPTTDPDLSSVDAADPSVEANGGASTTVTVTLLDSLSNALVGHDVTLGQDGSSTIVGGNTGTTDGSGQVAFTVTNITPETVTYDATDDTDSVAVTDTAEVEFTPIVSDPNNSTVDATDPSVAANGFASSTVTVTLLDSLSNPVPSHDVTLSQDGSSTIVGGNTGTTDGSGEVSFTVTNTNPETVTYTAEDTTDTIDVVDDAQVEFTAPLANAANSTVVATDPTVIADTVDETTITVTLFDEDNVRLAGHNVTLSQDGSSTIVGGNTGTTNAAGEVSFTVTSDTVETVTYTAEDTTNSVTVTQNAEVEFTPLPSDPDQSSVVITGDSAVPADGATSTTITVTLLNELDDPIVGHTVTLDQDDGSSVISGGAATDGSGQTVFTVTNTTQEFVTYTATDDTNSVTITDTVEVEFTEIPSDATQSTVSASPPTVLANGVGESIITVTLRSSSGTAVGGHTVTLDQGGGSASISGGGDTNGAGEVTFAVTNTTPELVTFEATDTTSAIDVLDDATVDFIEPTTDASQSTVTAADPVVEANGVATTTVTVTIRDADGAPLATPHNVTLSQGAGSSTIVGGDSGVTDGSGQVQFTVLNSTVEDVFYSANDDTGSVAVSQTAKVRFLIADEDASLSNLTTSEGSLSPSFNPNTLGYSASVSNGTDSTDVTPTTTQPGSTLTVNGDAATSGDPVTIDLNVGANPVEIIVTAPDATTTSTYKLTVNRSSPPAPVIFIPPPAPPQLRVDLTLTNDDGGTAAVEDFTIVVDDLAELTSGESVLLTFGGHVVSLTGPTAVYSVEFGGACFENGVVILLGGLSICTITLDDQPIGLVLSQALPDAAALIDESLSLTDDAFDRDGVAYVEASSAGTPPEITIAIPVDAIPGGGAITILVSPANELAIGQSPPPGALLIGGTGYVIQILDGDGNPITDFLLPLELSFLLPDGAGPVDAYSYDAELGIWVLEPGTTTGDRFEFTPNHLTTFALFGIAPDGGLVGSAPSRGIWLTTAEGGSVIQLRRALLKAGAVGAFVTYQGQWVSYLPSAPDFVNQGFQDFFATGIPQGHVLLISMDR